MPLDSALPPGTELEPAAMVVGGAEVSTPWSRLAPMYCMLVVTSVVHCSREPGAGVGRALQQRGSAAVLGERGFTAQPDQDEPFHGDHPSSQANAE